MGEDRQIVVRDRGAFVGKRGERLVVRLKDQVLEEVPFFNLSHLIIEGLGISLSADAVYGCIESGVQIDLLTSTGRPYAKLLSPALLGTVATRREQILAYLDHRGVDIALAVVVGKVHNQANVLRYFARSRRDTDPELHRFLEETAEKMKGLLQHLNGVVGQTADEVREDVMSLEAQCARLYWAALVKLLPHSLGFSGREHRGAADPVNACLNYGYGVLYTHVWGAVVLAGLEPFAGFLHVDRPGKPSLVLDLVEEFRPCVADRPVLAWLLRGKLARRQDGNGAGAADERKASRAIQEGPALGQPDEDGTLTRSAGEVVTGPADERFELAPSYRRQIAAGVLARLDDLVPYEGAKHKLRTVLQRQARLLASFLRGEGKYRAFVAPW